MARVNSMYSLSNSLERHTDRIELKTTYDFFEISRDISPIEESLATMNLSASNFEIEWRWKRLTLQGCPISDIGNFISVLKQLNINNLTIDINDDYVEEDGTLFPKLFGSMMPDGLFALKSICINEAGECSSLPLIDKPTTRELVRIKSIRFLKCSFVDWESIELLSELTNLQTLNIEIKSKFDKTYAKAICNLLNTCQGCTFIRCYDWIIEFKKKERIPGPTSNWMNTLKIFNLNKIRSLNELLEGLAYRTFTSNEELDISNLYLYFRDVHKVSEILTLKKLRITLLDINGIEKLSKLPELEELNISYEGKKSLIKLFDQLATRESPSLHSLRLRLISVSDDEVFMISRIRSLRKLVLFANFETLTGLANSNIEDLSLGAPYLSLQDLTAFAEKALSSFQHLQCDRTSFDAMELREVCKLKDLRTLHTRILEVLPYLQELKYLETLHVHIFNGMDLKHNLPTLKTLVIHSEIGLMECISLSELENLESLTVNLNDADGAGIHALFNMKSLRELIINRTSHSLDNVYMNLDCKSEMKLEHLSVPIRCLNELQGITSMKLLKKLQLKFMSDIFFDQSSHIEMGQLTELESLLTQFDLWSQPQNARGGFQLWPAIFKSCKNLSTFTIELTFDRENNFVRKVHTLLKSIRDPTNQDPLLLTVHLSIDLEISEFHLVEYIDDEYLKVYYIFLTA